MHWLVRGLSCKPNIYVSWSTSELRVRLAPLNRFKPSSKIFYWPFQGGTSFVDLLCFCSVLCLLCFVRVCLYVLCGHLLGKGWPLGSRLWCLLWVCHFPIGILGQVWYLIVSIPDLCTLTYFAKRRDLPSDHSDRQGTIFSIHPTNKWATTWDFQQCGICDQQTLRPACAYAQSDQSLC